MEELEEYKAMLYTRSGHIRNPIERYNRHKKLQICCLVLFLPKHYVPRVLLTINVIYVMESIKTCSNYVAAVSWAF